MIAALDRSIGTDAVAANKHVLDGVIVDQLHALVVNLHADYPTLQFRFDKADHFAHDVGRGTFYKLPSVRAAIAMILAELDGAIETQALSASVTLPTDALTGLLTRGSFDSDVPTTVSDGKKRAAPTALVMIDIDHFKKVNDTHGHPKGDEVLREFSRLVGTIVEGKGRAYRYGGEEVGVLLPNHSLEEAITVAERIRVAVHATKIADLTITASLGVAVAPVHASTFDELLKAADSALYDSKRRGRNLVSAFGEKDAPASAPRIPERKLPESSALTEEEAARLRASYFRTRGAFCPRDNAILDVRRVHPIGEPTPMLFVSCPLCGLDAQI